jgi:hypothetical protein
MSHGIPNFPNFKWSVKDIDEIIRRARQGQSASSIARAWSDTGKFTTTEEIIRICGDARVAVRGGALSA